MSPVKLKHLFLRSGTYYYVRRSGGRVVWKRLSRDLSEALRLWQQLEAEAAPSASRTVAAAIDRYLAASADRLAPSTVEAYGKHRRRLEAAFAEFTDVAQIRPAHVRQYLDARSKKAAGNQEIGLLSGALRHVMGLGWIDTNPVQGIRKHALKPRRRCLSDAELASLREHASDRLRAMIDISLLTAMRQGDLLALRLADLTDAGISVEHGKTGARVLYTWTPALQEAVGRAKRLRRRIGSVLLFADDRGAQIKADSLRASWVRLCAKAGVHDAHWHDIRATSLTLAKEAQGLDYAKTLAGHSSARMTEAYVAARAVTKVRPIR